MNRSILAVAVASLLPYTSLSYAQDASADETMVVIARSNNANTISDIPSNVVVISREEIEKSGAQSLEALLRGRVGIQVSDSNSGAAFSLRGFSGEQASNNTLVLLDGRRLNSLDLVSPNLSFVQLDDIESIEILSGSAGVLYGDQAVGGVINIVTRSSKEERVGVSATYGSFDTTSLNASASGQVDDRLSYRFSATKHDSDNFRENNASDDSSILGRLDYDDESKKLFLELAFYDTYRELAGSLTEQQYKDDPTKANSDQIGDFSREITRAARVGYQQSLDGNWWLKNELLVDDTTGNGASYSGAAWASKNNIQSGQLFLSSQVEGKVASSNIILGLDAAKNNYDYASPSTDRDTEQTKYDIYTQVQYPVISSLTLTAGLRHARVSDDLTDKSIYPSGQKIKDDATAYELSLNYKLNSKTRLYARTESNFRFAKVSEQSYTPPGIVGLKPQTGLSNEVGIHLIDPAYSLRLDAYQLKLDDEIVFVADPALTPIGGGFTGANVNADSSTRYGATLSGDYTVTEDLWLSAEYSYIDAEITEGENKGNDVAWVANHTGKVGFGYYLTESLDVVADAVYTGKRYQDGDNGNELDKLDAYWLTNIAANYNYRDLTLSLRIDNVFDEGYADYVFYNGFSSGYYSGDERAYHVTANYQF